MLARARERARQFAKGVSHACKEPRQAMLARASRAMLKSIFIKQILDTINMGLDIGRQRD